MERTFEIHLEEADFGERLDKTLAKHIPDISRELLQKAIKAGQVLGSDGQSIGSKPSAKIEEMDALSITLALPELPNVSPIPLKDFFGEDLEILFEDDHLLFINKPVGLTVHPGAGTTEPTLVHALLHHCNLSSTPTAPLRPGIVHRLDKDTSGVMVVAKTDIAHAKLARLFEKRKMTRSYVAICYGSPLPVIGEIEAPIGRHPTARTKMAVVKEGDSKGEGGKYARTHYQVLQNFNGHASLLQCRLATGRTHQIRVHLAYRKHPVMGDGTYARQQKLKGVPADFAYPTRQMLHAQELGFIHPITKEEIHARATPPADFEKCLETLSKLKK